MNWDKYNPHINELTENEDILGVFNLGEFFDSLPLTIVNGKRTYHLLRSDAHMILKSCTFKELTDKKKKDISRMLKECRFSETGEFPPNPPKKPVVIDINEYRIVDGVGRLFGVNYVRDTDLWIELVGGTNE